MKNPGTGDELTILETEPETGFDSLPVYVLLSEFQNSLEEAPDAQVLGVLEVVRVCDEEIKERRCRRMLKDHNQLTNHGNYLVNGVMHNHSRYMAQALRKVACCFVLF